MEGCFMFQWGWGWGGWGGVFQLGGFIFKWGVQPMGRDIGFDGEVSKKIVG